MTKRKTITIAAICVGIAGGCWFIAGQMSAGGLPLGSTKVISNWKEFNNGRPYAESGVPPYFWTSNGDLLYRSDNPDRTEDVRRYQLTPRNTLGPYNGPSIIIPRGAMFLEPTPDGSGLLYETMNARHPNDPDLHLLSADGKSDRLLPAIWMFDRIWLPDGKHWVISRSDGDFLNGTDGIPLRKLDTRSVSKWYPFVLGANHESHAIATVLASGYFAAQGPSPRDAAVNYPYVRLIEFDINSPLAILREFRARVPDQAQSGSVLISPAADRILWVVDERVPAMVQLLNRILPRKMRIVQGDQAVYVSRLDGSGMRKLSSAHRLQRVSDRFRTSVNNLMMDIRWLPDGKRISFISNNALYIAPVD